MNYKYTAMGKMETPRRQRKTELDGETQDPKSKPGPIAELMYYCSSPKCTTECRKWHIKNSNLSRVHKIWQSCIWQQTIMRQFNCSYSGAKMQPKVHPLHDLCHFIDLGKICSLWSTHSDCVWQGTSK